MPQATAADETELQIRIDEVKDMIVKGMKQREIVRYCLEKHADWNLTDRRIRDYVYAAKNQLSEEAPAIDRRAEFSKAVRRNELIFNEAIKIKDLKTAQSANVSNMKLMRLDDPKFKMDWRNIMEAEGLDPEESMKQFIQLLNAQAAQDANEYEPDEGEYGNE